MTGALAQYGCGVVAAAGVIVDALAGVTTGVDAAGVMDVGVAVVAGRVTADGAALSTPGVDTTVEAAGLFAHVANGSASKPTTLSGRVRPRRMHRKGTELFIGMFKREFYSDALADRLGQTAPTSCRTESL